jgi:hypothetical protein
VPADLLSPPPAPPFRLLLTARQAAESLSICEKTLWSITMPRGPLRAVKIGRSVRYSIQDLREFIEAANAAAGK